jgi:hypothetical protein
VRVEVVAGRSDARIVDPSEAGAVLSKCGMRCARARSDGSVVTSEKAQNAFTTLAPASPSLSRRIGAMVRFSAWT